MSGSTEIRNKVAESGLVTLDLETFYTEGERMLIDISELLHEGLVLREKDFRQYVESHDWSQYADKFIAVHCSTDAIIPVWAYMLISSELAPYAKLVVQGTSEDLEVFLFEQKINEWDPSVYRDKRIVLKGCGDKHIPASAYMRVTGLLRPYAKSIMYGEPCSTVPVFKQKK